MDATYPVPHYDWLLKSQPEIGAGLALAKEMSDGLRVSKSATGDSDCPAPEASATLAEWLVRDFAAGPYDEVFKNELHCMLDYDRWGQQVFCIPKIMQEKLDATDISKVGIEELGRMPYPCFYVNMRSCGWKLWSLYDECYYPISGFYVLRDNRKSDHEVDQLLFFLHAEGAGGEFGSKFFMNLDLVRCFRDFECVKDYVKRILSDPSREYSSPGVEKAAEDGNSVNVQTFMSVYRVFVSLLMYINTKDPSIRKDRSGIEERNRLKAKLRNCKKPNGKKARRYKTMLSRVSGATVRYIGERDEALVVNSPGFSWEAKRQWRRGHNHNFWSGPKKYPVGHEGAGQWIPYEAWDVATYPAGHERGGEKIRSMEELWLEPVLINPDKEVDAGPREYGFTLSQEKKHKLLKDFIYKEGRAKEVVLNVYERDPKARAACLEHHGFICKVCDYEPEKHHKLGHLVAKYLQVHHVNPLHEVGEEHVVDPIKDLVPVCYECHKYIHSRGTKKKPYTVEELREMIGFLADKEVAV
mgnify:CR=1 FL=1|tara:strand:- start:36113 stop:37690 length:1578 start_codon:yes stop_codon:yes gene_type:complete